MSNLRSVPSNDLYRQRGLSETEVQELFHTQPKSAFQQRIASFNAKAAAVATSAAPIKSPTDRIIARQKQQQTLAKMKLNRD
jgi:PIN domain nuclease of toxin-antitoxin system